MNTKELQERLNTAFAEESKGNYAEAERLSQQVLIELGAEAPPPDFGAEDTTPMVLRAEATRLLGLVAIRRGSSSRALEYNQEALSLAEAAGATAIQAKIMNNIGMLYSSLSDYSKSLEHYTRALSLLEAAGDKASVARVTGNIGIVYASLSDYPKSLEYYTRALSLYEELGDKASAANVIGNIGAVYQSLSDYPKSLEYYTRALSQHEEVGNKAGVAVVTGNIGNLHRGLADYPKALEYLAQAMFQHEEVGNKIGMANVTLNIGNVYNSCSDYPKALEYLAQGLSLYEQVGNKVGVATATSNIGNVYMALSDYPKALEYFTQALSQHEALGDKSGVARVLGNIGSVYGLLSDYPKALEYFTRALSQFEEVGDKESMAQATGSIGMVYMELSYYPKALEYYTRALSQHEDLGSKASVAWVMGNIGSVYLSLSDYPKALEYLSRSLKWQEDLGQRTEAANILTTLGRLYASETNPDRDEAKAEAFLLKSITISEELGTKKYEAHKTLAEIYERQERWQEANIERKKYHELEKEVRSEEAKKSASLIEQRRQAAEREKEIAIAKTAADAKLHATTVLLHKVLPPSIAQRMIDGEEEIADYFPQVSILFADIAGFTPISADMPAFMVVRFLNFVFREFDRIIDKHGCEKIKTIGDGYMAISGAPEECADHAERLAAAALEMQMPIRLPDDIREYLPDGQKFGIRIGLHTGSIVAGVIGEKRFVYDVYSDAVNTAARMESHGEPDRIHVTQDFVRHLQNRFAMTKNTTHGLTFEKRGELEIKGKGPMRTYYLQKA